MIPRLTTLLSLFLLLVCQPDIGNTADRSVKTGFVVEVIPGTVFFRIVTPDGQKTLLASGPFLRVGRKPTVGEHRAYFSNRKKYWWPYILREAKLVQRSDRKEQDITIIYSQYEFTRPDDRAQKVRLNFWLKISPQGWIEVDYDLVPVRVSDYVLELGISFLLPREMRIFSWRGQGPGASYARPAKSSTHGIYRFLSAETQFGGNKADVDLAVVVDQQGNGLGLSGEAENITCDVVKDGILVSHNLMVAGQSTELKLTRDTIRLSDVDKATGSFRLVPLIAGEWPEEFRVLSPFNTIESPLQFKSIHRR